MPRLSTAVLASTIAACTALVAARQLSPPRPPCDPDNGALALPEGFCAAVVADNLGPARHLTVAPSGDLSRMGSRHAAGSLYVSDDAGGRIWKISYDPLRDGAGLRRVQSVRGVR